MTGKQLCTLWIVGVGLCISGAAVFGGHAVYGDLVLGDGFAATISRLAAALGFCAVGIGINNTLGRATVAALGREEAERSTQN